MQDIGLVTPNPGVMEISIELLSSSNSVRLKSTCPDSKVHGANMGPTWLLSAPDGPHVPCHQGVKNNVLIIDLLLQPHTSESTVI